MCHYFFKTEDQYLQAMQQEAKEAYENNMHHHDAKNRKELLKLT